MKNRPVTINDIAKELGISANAVSLALRDRSDISDSMKEKVREKAAELGYKKNYSAASLRTRQSKTIGLILPNIANPFFSEMYQGVEKACREKGYTIIFSTSNENHDFEKNAINNMINHQIDGIVICPASDRKSNTQMMKKSGIPFVSIGRDADEKDICSFFCSDIKGGYLACRELLDAGCRKPAFLTISLDFAPSRDRVQGARECLADFRIDPDELIVSISNTPGVNDSYYAMKKLYEEGFCADGLFAFEDEMAIGAMRFLCDAGVRIPEQVPVIGYNDIKLDNLVEPTLSSVSIFGETTAYEGTLTLFEIIEGTYEGKVKNIFDPVVIRRGSTSR